MSDTYKVVILRNSDEGIEVEIIPGSLEGTIRFTDSSADVLEFGSRNPKDFADTIEAWRDLFQAALNEVRPTENQQDGGS